MLPIKIYQNGDSRNPTKEELYDVMKKYFPFATEEEFLSFEIYVENENSYVPIRKILEILEG